MYPYTASGTYPRILGRYVRDERALSIEDRATYEQPRQLATGVRDVFVNGVAVIQDGRHTGAKPGRALRGPGWRPELSTR